MIADNFRFGPMTGSSIQAPPNAAPDPIMALVAAYRFYISYDCEEDLDDRANALEEEIIGTPSLSVEGLLSKLRVLSDFLGIDDDPADYSQRLLASVISDIRALVGASGVAP